jgi:hypothetical protein
MLNFKEFIQSLTEVRTGVMKGPLKPQGHLEPFHAAEPAKTWIHHAPKMKREINPQHQSGPLKPAGAPEHIPTQNKQNHSTVSVPHHTTGGQFGKVGKVVRTYPNGACKNCGNRNVIKMDHTQHPGHEGTNRWCYDCGHKWKSGGIPKEPMKHQWKEEAEETEEGIKTPFDPAKIRGEEVHESFATSMEHPMSLTARDHGYKFDTTHHTGSQTTHTFFHPSGKKLQLITHREGGERIHRATANGMHHGTASSLNAHLSVLHHEKSDPGNIPKSAVNAIHGVRPYSTQRTSHQMAENDIKDIGKVELAPYGSSVVKENRLDYLVNRILRYIH